MNEQPKLGELLKGDEKRDAIHVALLPVKAGHRLCPGQHVGLIGYNEDAGVYVASGNAEHVGIIDPYLNGYVSPGEHCWLCFYPNTVTSLRHAFTHPSLDKIHRRNHEQS